MMNDYNLSTLYGPAIPSGTKVYKGSQVPTSNILTIGDWLSDQIINESNELRIHSYNEAAYHLQRRTTGNERLPDMIIGVLKQSSLKEILNFGKFISNDIRFATIPFVLIEVTDDFKASTYGQIPGVDDVVKNNISSEEFNRKISLIKKYKLLKQSNSMHIESLDNAIPADRRILYKIDMCFRRIMDVILSTLTLLILSPLLLTIAIAIKIDSRGPIFYTSYRAGSGYRIFKFIKFRTMIVEADHKLATLAAHNQYQTTDKANQVFFKISNDPRITRIGRFLRNTSLDELPQLLNVLKSDMSIVGNRPLPLYEARALTSDNHAERFNAPAGITGLWQISKRGQKKMSVEERIALDIDYARHNSSADYFQIILKTPRALFQKENV